VAGFFEYGDELSGSVKCGEFHECLRRFLLLRKDCSME
jgi:hypothetical protein